jgi:hypothetical protein
LNKFLFHFKYSLKKYLNKVGISFTDRALMVPKMTYKEARFFTDYLTENISSLYLESGSGGSTLIANSLGFEFHSYETSEAYTTYMNQLLQANKVTHVSVGKVQKYGRPIEVNPTITHKIASVFDAHLSKNVNQRVIVFLDGRCRVLTALYIHAKLSDQDSVLVHDFTRLKYQDILQAYHIIDQADSLVLLQKKNIANDVLQQLKKKYKLDIE